MRSRSGSRRDWRLRHGCRRDWRLRQWCMRDWRLRQWCGVCNEILDRFVGRDHNRRRESARQPLDIPICRFAQVLGISVQLCASSVAWDVPTMGPIWKGGASGSLEERCGGGDNKSSNSSQRATPPCHYASGPNRSSDLRPRRRCRNLRSPFVIWVTSGNRKSGTKKWPDIFLPQVSIVRAPKLRRRFFQALAMEPYSFDPTPEPHTIGCTYGGGLAESRSTPLQPCQWRGLRVSQHNCSAFRLHSRLAASEGLRV